MPVVAKLVRGGRVWEAILKVEIVGHPDQGSRLGLRFFSQFRGDLNQKPAIWSDSEEVYDEFSVGPAESKQLEAHERKQS